MPKASLILRIITVYHFKLSILIMPLPLGMYLSPRYLVPEDGCLWKQHLGLGNMKGGGGKTL